MTTGYLADRHPIKPHPQSLTRVRCVDFGDCFDRSGAVAECTYCSFTPSYFREVQTEESANGDIPRVYAPASPVVGTFAVKDPTRRAALYLGGHSHKESFPMNNPAIPAAVEANGVLYLPGQGGTLTPVANIKRQDLLRHETVYEITDFALDLSAEIARFNGHSRADLAAFDALLAEEYGMTRDPDLQGNRTYTSLDGERQIKIAVGKHISYGTSLQMAKKLLDELIADNSSAAGPVLLPLINHAFRVDKEGKVDPDMLRAIRRLEIEDPLWPTIVKAIDDAEEVRDTTTYLRFYRKSVNGKMELIPLDIAVAHPTAEAFNRPSLRRKVAELQAQIAEMTAEPEEAGEELPPPTLTDHVFMAQQNLAWVLRNLEDARAMGRLERLPTTIAVLKTELANLEIMTAERRPAALELSAQATGEGAAP